MGRLREFQTLIQHIEARRYFRANITSLNAFVSPWCYSKACRLCPKVNPNEDR